MDGDEQDLSRGFPSVEFFGGKHEHGPGKTLFTGFGNELLIFSLHPVETPNVHEAPIAEERHGMYRFQHLSRLALLSVKDAQAQIAIGRRDEGLFQNLKRPLPLDGTVALHQIGRMKLAACQLLLKFVDCQCVPPR